MLRPVEPPRGDIDPPRTDIGGALGLAEDLRTLLERRVGMAQFAGAYAQRDALFGEFGQHRQRRDLVFAEGMGVGRDRA